jgi:mitochondrial fission protein ELM1
VKASGQRVPPPMVWVLTDDRPGNTTQSVGLARALGWSHEIKELHFTPLARLIRRWFVPFVATRRGLDASRSAPLARPWPDIIIAAGWRPGQIARWIRKQSRGHSRIIQLGRKGGHIAELFDVVVTPMYARLPLHPRRIETVVPLTQVTTERLAQAAERWKNLFDNAPHPRIALLVGGPTVRHRLDVDTALRMGEEVRTFAHAVRGSVFAITSRRTGLEATEALRRGLGESRYLHQWQPGQQDNPYLAYLALADVLVVTGESESMLAEAATAGKPLYIYPLPERPPSLRAQLREWVVTCAQARRVKHYEMGWLRQGCASLCAWLIERGVVRPRRDLNMLHQTLICRRIARPFGEPLDTENCPVLRESDEVARKVRTLLGFMDS